MNCCLPDNSCNIMHVSHSPWINGAELCLYNLITHLDRERINSITVFPNNGPMIALLEGYVANSYISSLNSWVNCNDEVYPPDDDLVSRVQSLVNIICQENVALVHTNTSVIWEGALAARLAGVPHIWHVHEVLDDNPRLKPYIPIPLFYKIIENLSDRVVSVSHALSEKLARYIDYKKIVTIHNGLDANRFTGCDGDTFRKEIGLSESDIVVTSIGSLVSEKGHDVFLDAAGKACQWGMSLKFLIVGDGTHENQDALRKKVRDLGIDGRVIFTGFRTDIPRILNATDIVVVSSWTESFSLVSVEAMATGKVVVATDCGGPREIILHGKTGYLVEVGDSASIAERIIELAEQPKIRQKMGEEGRKRFNEKFRAEAFANRFLELYQEILSSSGSCELSNRDVLLVNGYMDTYRLIQKNIWLDQQITSLLNSTSWRVTAPLRYVHSKISKLVGR